MKYYAHLLRIARIFGLLVTVGTRIEAASGDPGPARMDPSSSSANVTALLEAEWCSPEGLRQMAPRASAHRSGSAGKPTAQTSVFGAAAQETIVRQLSLAEDLRHKGAEVTKEFAALEKLARRVEQIQIDQPESDSLRQLYVEARGLGRELALRNPLLDFESILFVKSAPSRFPHMSDQFYGWWSRPGGGVFLLNGFKTAEPGVRCLTADLPEGSFVRPELSYDATRVLFAYCRYYSHVPEIKNKRDKANLPEDAFYHLYEMNLHSGERRQLTHGRYDDFDARYLPNGDIVFLSTRKGQFLQCSPANTDQTRGADLPDSYVRCGGDDYRPVPVFTLHAMDAHGQNLRPISAFENFEWTPAVANDGRILYTRWDYIDRFNGPFFSLWSTNPDGSNPQLVYGNYTVRPQVVGEAVPIPHSRKLMFVAGAHHSILGGSLVLFDRERGTEEESPLVRLTPEVPFPETEAFTNSYYANPFPLSEDYYLAGWSNRKLPPHGRYDDVAQNPVNAMGLYLYDRFGNLNLLYRDPAISSGNPIPVRPRSKPPVYSDMAQQTTPDGNFLVQDIYQGLPGIKRGSVKSLRVIGVPPKPQPLMNQPSLGVSAEDPGKILLGTVPVEADGSAYFRVPSGLSVLFQALDEAGLAVQTMRSLTYVWPNQTLACIGCHESRDSAPTGTRRPLLAATREPSRLKPGPPGTWPLRYDRLVQPVLDAACVRCHRPGSEDIQAARLDLTSPKSYENLLAFGQKNLQHLAFERDRSVVGQCAASKSKLLALLQDPQGHAGVHLDASSLERFIVWMDLYAQRQGQFSPQQEAQLASLRQQLAPLLTAEDR